MDSINPKLSKRIISYDIIRIIAVLAVVMIHSSADFVDSYPKDSINSVLGNVFDSVSRIGLLCLLCFREL